MARAAILLCFSLLCLGAAAAANPVVPDPQAQRQDELRRVNEDLRLGQDRVETLRGELAGFKAAQATLTEQLIGAAARLKAREAEMTAAEHRLASLEGGEATIRASLSSRRAMLSELLAALQRIGRSPPPALLARPDDALGAVRAALQLGAALPELRAEADALAFDLTEMAALKMRAAAERETLSNEAAQLEMERKGLSLLVEEKRRREAMAANTLVDEQLRVEKLGASARSLEELIGRAERELASAATAAAPQMVNAAAGLGTAVRMMPATPFSAVQGSLALPASGARVRGFGEADGFGAMSKGLSLATRPKAQITAPADGWVVYAGPFRTYGQLLILNAGDGYHLLLAGAERIDVEVGQFVLAGEPVAVMGDARPAGISALAQGSSQPILYVEFRKDGVAIDPAPWWASKSFEKVRE